MKNQNKRIKFAATNPNLQLSAPTADSAPGSIATLKGTAIVYNQLSSDRGGYQVRLMPNSATFTTPTSALYQHDFSKLIGNTANKTLRLNPTDTGVDVEIDLPDTTTGHDVKTLVGRGDIAGMSFTMANGFEESFATNEATGKVINATKYTVDEVTICVNPAFTGTTISVADDEDDDDAEDDGTPTTDAIPTPVGGMSKKKSDTKEEYTDHSWKWEEYRHYLYGLDVGRDQQKGK